jgi:hypothetical protein
LASVRPEMLTFAGSALARAPNRNTSQVNERASAKPPSSAKRMIWR